MLSGRERQLVTAYVDGELSARQRRHVARLLHRSREARRLLKKLQRDSCELRRLQTPALETDLAFPVLRTIAERHLAIRRSEPGASATGPRDVYPAWAGAAFAAAVLLAVLTSSYVFFASVLARNSPAPPPAEAKPPHDSSSVGRAAQQRQ
jgi:anti-sigma factor RsiW